MSLEQTLNNYITQVLVPQLITITVKVHKELFINTQKAHTKEYRSTSPVTSFVYYGFILHWEETWCKLHPQCRKQISRCLRQTGPGGVVQTMHFLCVAVSPSWCIAHICKYSIHWVMLKRQLTPHYSQVLKKETPAPKCEHTYCCLLVC